MDFEWDPNKAEINLRKHGVSFLEQAQYLVMTWRSLSPTPIIPMMKSVSSRLDGQTAADY